MSKFMTNRVRLRDEVSVSRTLKREAASKDIQHAQMTLVFEFHVHNKWSLLCNKLCLL